MFNNIIIVATVIALIFVYFGSMFFVAAMAKKKINVQALVDKTKAEIPVFDQVVTLLENLMPQPFKSMAQIIVTYIQKAVDLAEDLSDAGKITADQRKVTALKYIDSALTLEKIEVNDKVKNAISLAVDLAAILFVPHKDEKAPQANDTPVADTSAQAATAGQTNVKNYSINITAPENATPAELAQKATEAMKQAQTAAQ